MGINIPSNEVEISLPKIELKKRYKKIVISGRSRMLDPGEYYNNFANNLSDYYNEFKHTLYLEFYFDYINTGSSKWLLFLMQYLDSMKKERGGNLEVVWKFDVDDETIQETGEVIQSNLSIPFHLKPV